MKVSLFLWKNLQNHSLHPLNYFFRQIFNKSQIHFNEFSHKVKLTAYDDLVSNFNGHYGKGGNRKKKNRSYLVIFGNKTYGFSIF